MSSNYKADAITISLRTLQQEKSNLEQKLRELRQKQHEKEKLSNHHKTKLGQSKELNCKLKETLKVAQHKVSEQQREMKSLQDTTCAKRKGVDTLNQNIKKEEEKNLHSTLQFEEFLAKLATKFHDARHFYTEENLKITIETSKEQITELEKNKDKLQQQKVALAGTLQQLKQKQDDVYAAASDLGLPADIQQNVLMSAKQDLDDLRQQKASLFNTKEITDQ